MAFVPETHNSDLYVGSDTSTPWRRSKRGCFRYMYGWLLIVSRTKIVGPRRGFSVRWESTVDGAPAPARSEGLHLTAAAAKDAAEDYVRRSCERCRRKGYLSNLDGTTYRCDSCGGTGTFRG